jgi:ketosteroid isomerase-like protein
VVASAAVTDRAAIASWVETYERAWRTAGTDALASLFTSDATYSMEPYDTPAQGLGAIAELWERERTGPDERFTMTSEIVAVEGDVGVVRIEVDYPDKRLTFRDLWIIRLDANGRCLAFEEWPFWPEKGFTPAPSH